MTTDLKGRIHEEILKTGFPLELRTAHYLQSREYHVAHNVYFVDRDEGKGREIDLRALKNSFFQENEQRFAVRHCLVLECKKSTSRPWVVFTSPTVSYDQDVSEIPSAGAKDDLWFEPLLENFMRFQASHPWFSQPQRGRSYFEPFASGSESNQTIFKSLVSVVKAMIEVRHSGFAAGGNRKLHDLAFYYPLIVFEGQLFTARLAESDLHVEEADAVPISFFYQSAEYAEDQVHTVLVVQEQALEREVQRLDKWLLIVAEYLKSHTDRFKDLGELNRTGREAKRSNDERR